MKLKIIIILVILTSHSLIYSQNYTISGYVKDKESGEIIIGANVFDKFTNKGTSTNSFGFYSLTLKKDSAHIIYTYLGYSVDESKFYLSKDTTITQNLENSNEIKKITITAEQTSRQNTNGSIKMTANTINNLPALLGEKDALKVMQLMPGVNTSDEGSSNLIVRGGSPDQNLILFDDVPLYYVNHLGGFVSVFNPYSIKNIELIKGGFPAEYGGRLSSIIDIRTKDGNLKKTEGEIELGLMSAKFSLEGPIQKDKSSYILSVRKGLFDIYSNALNFFSDNNQKAGYNFYDINIKLNYHFSSKSQLSFSFYNGIDKIGLDFSKNESGISVNNIFDVKWGNNLAALRWNYKYSKKIFGNITLATTDYSYKNFIYSEYNTINDTIEKQKIISTDFKTRITDYILKSDYDYYLNNSYLLKFGFSTTFHNFKPAVISSNYIVDSIPIIDTTFSPNKLNSTELALYVSNKIKLFNFSHLKLGLRYVNYFVKNANYNSIEPRISLNFKISKKINIKADYVEMTQFLHLLANSSTGSPADFWVLPTSIIPPQKSKMISIGFFSLLFDKKIELSAEIYSKILTDLIEIKEGESLLWSTEDWQNKIDINGTGKSKGLEILFQKPNGRINGWLAYSWSKSTRQFENQNLGRTYPYTYDRTHNFSIVTMFKLNKKISFSSNWVYMTGKIVSFANGKYYTLSSFELYNNELTNVFYDILIYDEKNNYRMPPVHNLDVTINFKKEIKKTTRTWSLSIYNVYNRKNAYLYYYDEIMDNGSRNTVLKKVTLFPIIPSISYSLKF